MMDPLPHQVLLETLLVDRMPATADVLMQQEARNILREPEGKTAAGIPYSGTIQRIGETGWYDGSAGGSSCRKVRVRKREQQYPCNRMPIMDHSRIGNITVLPHNPVVIPAVLHRQARSLRRQARPVTSPKKRLPRGNGPNGLGSCPGYWTRSFPIAASSSFPLQSLFPLNLLLFGGFRRISKKNVLEHDARKVIYQAIAATPGIDIRTLTGMTGINENTLRYHLDRLVATGKISSFTRPGIVRYFQNQGAIQSVRAPGLPLFPDRYPVRDPPAASPEPGTDPSAYCRCPHDCRPIGHTADGQPDRRRDR